MKKAISILIIMVYSMSSFGVSLKASYCCGKLKSIALMLGDNNQHKDCKSDNKNCCKLKFQYLKVHDQHTTPAQTKVPPSCTVVLHVIITSTLSVDTTGQCVPPANKGHDPPLHAGVATYLSNRVFRI